MEFFLRFNNIIPRLGETTYRVGVLGSYTIYQLMGQNVFKSNHPQWTILMDHLLPLIRKNFQITLKNPVMRIYSLKEYDKHKINDKSLTTSLIHIYIDWHDYLSESAFSELCTFTSGPYFEFITEPQNFTRMLPSSEIIVNYDKVLPELKIGNKKLQIYLDGNKFIINIDIDNFVGKVILNQKTANN
jgi:hypothetical protein